MSKETEQKFKEFIQNGGKVQRLPYLPDPALSLFWEDAREDAFWARHNRLVMRGRAA